jgi:uncharacterized protein (TIGR02217 family)
MAFDEVQFPESISYGSSGGPRRLTQIVPLKSGYEKRNQVWENSRRQYDAGVGIRDINACHDVIEFWEARSGPLHGFRWKDWADYKSCRPTETPAFDDVIIATGDGVDTTFQLVKRYVSSGREYVRPIKKPVAGSVLIGLGGVAQGSGWTLDSTTGIITFSSAPGNGVNISAGFEFDVPVRFDNNEVDVSIEGFEAGAVPSIKIVEIQV